jgi:hypothetical protein
MFPIGKQGWGGALERVRTTQELSTAHMKLCTRCGMCSVHIHICSIEKIARQLRFEATLRHTASVQFTLTKWSAANPGHALDHLGSLIKTYCLSSLLYAQAMDALANIITMPPSEQSSDEYGPGDKLLENTQHMHTESWERRRTFVGRAGTATGLLSCDTQAKQVRSIRGRSYRAKLAFDFSKMTLNLHE